MANYSFGQIKVDELNIDTTITGFKFAANFQGTHVFTKNGASDLNTNNPTTFLVKISPNMSATIAKEKLERISNESPQSGYKISNLIKKDTTLNGYSAFYISYIETSDMINYKSFIFNAYLSKDNTIVFFFSGDIDNGKYIEKFKRTFYSIKF
ncbi:MAG: hypothetical protein IPH57_11550 [Saprospiraceae bacterium]|nr:hypothetical protein [Saprospiraceae bacterium]